MGYHQAVEVPDCFLYNLCQRGREDFPSGFHGERGRLQFALQDITTDSQQFQQQFMAVGKHADIQSAQERSSADSHGWIHHAILPHTVCQSVCYRTSVGSLEEPELMVRRTGNNRYR